LSGSEHAQNVDFAGGFGIAGVGSYLVDDTMFRYEDLSAPGMILAGAADVGVPLQHPTELTQGVPAEPAACARTGLKQPLADLPQVIGGSRGGANSPQSTG
jgi:hypothetical protein